MWSSDPWRFSRPIQGVYEVETKFLFLFLFLIILKCYLLFSSIIPSQVYKEVFQRLRDMILQETECRDREENPAVFLQPYLKPGPSGPLLPFHAHPTLRSDWTNHRLWHVNCCPSSALLLCPFPGGTPSSCLLSAGRAQFHTPPLETCSLSPCLPTHKPAGISFLSYNIYRLFCTLNVYFAVALKSLRNNVLWVDLCLVL